MDVAIAVLNDFVRVAKYYTGKVPIIAEYQLSPFSFFSTKNNKINDDVFYDV